MLWHLLLLLVIMKFSPLFTPVRLVIITIALILLLGVVFYDPAPVPDPTRPHTPIAATPHNNASVPGTTRTGTPEAREAAFLNDAMCKEMALSLGGDPAQLAQNWQVAQSQAKAQVESMLQQAINSGDPQQRAAALFMHAEIQAVKIPQEYKEKYPKCVSNPTCLQQMEAATTAARTKDFNEIAKMASTSRDPQLYATAFHACNTLELAAQRMLESEGFCQQISASQWALRDPENGFAWLHTAQQAGKNAELDNAMFHIGQAKLFNKRLLGLPQLRTSFKLAQQNGFVQLELGNLNNTIHRLSNSPAYKPVLDYCQADQLAIGNRRQICNAIAERLLQDQTQSVSTSIATEIGEQLGWPAEKTAAARLEQDAISGLVDEQIRMRNGAPNPAPNPALNPALSPALNSTMQTCQDSARIAKSALQTMEFGEMDQWRKDLAKQTRSKAELAARFREDFLKEMNQGAAAQKK